MSGLTRRQFVQGSVAATAVGGLLDKTVANAAEPGLDVEYGSVTKVPMLCRMCAQFCPMVGHVIKGRLIRIESNKNSPHAGICARGRAAVGALYSPDRIKTPLIRTGERGEGKFRKATWDEALEMVTGKLRELREQGEARSVAYLPRFSSGAGLDKEFFKIFGTPNIVGYGDTCFGNSLTVSYGSILGGKKDKGVPGGGTGALSPDYENADYGILINRNPGGGLVTFPWGVMFGRGKKNGLKVTVVDPRRPSEAGESDQDWVPIRPGTDLAFLLGVLNVIFSKKYYDAAYLQKNTNAEMLIDVATGLPLEMKMDEKHEDYLVFCEQAEGPVFKSVAGKPALTGSFTVNGTTVKTALQMLMDEAQQYTPAWAQEICDVPADRIIATAEKLNAAKPKVFIERGYRTTRYANSMKEKHVIVMINSLLGAIGAKGGVIMQRKAKVGSYMKPPKTSEVSVAKHYRKHDPNNGLANTKHYRRTYVRGVLEDQPYKHRVAIINGQNPVGGSAGAKEVIKALKKLDLVVDVTPFWSETNMFADVILPECTFMERDEAIRYKFKTPYPTIAVHRKAVEPLYESHSGHWIFNELARNTLSAEEYEQYYGDYDRRGIQSIWDKQLKKVTASPEELLSFSPQKLFRDGVWASKIKYGIKAKTPTGKVEIYSTFLADFSYQMKEDGNEFTDYASPLANWVEPFWRKEKTAMDSDEFLPITGFSPLNTFTGSQTRNNPLLTQVGNAVDWTAVFINTKRGKELGLKDGELIDITHAKYPEKKSRAMVRLSETIQPDTLFTYYGSGAGFLKTQGKHLRFEAETGFNPNHISDLGFSPFDGGQLSQDFTVKIRRAS